MAERSTWAETHLNAVNKLLCWDRSFLGKATRSVGTSHIPASRAVHLAVRRERQVGEGGGKQFRILRKKRARLSIAQAPRA